MIEAEVATSPGSLLRVRPYLIMLWSSVMAWNSIAHAEYRLVWSDEFDGSAIDSESWEHEVNGDGGGNNELQFYTDRFENSFIENGCLVIQARKESYQGHEYTSARLNTKGKRDYLYGKFEARIKIPSSPGLWSAFWMMPTDSAYGVWAASGEIDILEAVNAHPSRVHGTIHFGGTWPQNMYQGGTYEGPKDAVGSIDFSEDFHVYTVEWQPYEIRWYVDGNLYSTQRQWHSTGGPFPAPFDKKFHILLNLAVGGRMPGPPDASTQWPQRMYVDWVRVYQTTNRPPEVEIVKPIVDQHFPEGSEIEIIADASDPDDNIARVVFYAGQEQIGVDEEPPFGMTWSPPDGHYSLTVKAEDKEGFACTRTVKIVQGKGTVQSPYHEEPLTIPGRIEAEDFDKGIAGDAYWDFDEQNQGGAYRVEDEVDIQLCTEGGFDLGWIVDDEWLEYTVNVTRSGDYRTVFRVASPDGGGALALDLDGTAIIANVSIPKTGDWQSWRDVTSDWIRLNSGIHTIRLQIVRGGFNLNYIELLPDKN